MKISYSKKSLKQIDKFDKKMQKRVFDYMDDVALLENPRSRGKALVGNLAGFWRYRVGDYRILCKIKDCELVVTVVEVAHRKKVYE